MNLAFQRPNDKTRQGLFLDEFGQLGIILRAIQTVDAGPEAEFEEVHLPGAISLTPDAALQDAATEVPLMTRAILVYGNEANA